MTETGLRYQIAVRIKHIRRLIAAGDEMASFYAMVQAHDGFSLLAQRDEAPAASGEIEASSYPVSPAPGQRAGRKGTR